MALVSVGFYASVQLLDEEGSQVTKEYNLDVADATAAAAAAAQIATDLAAITDAAIGSYRWGQIFAENALVLPDGVENEKRAVISAVINGSFPKKYVNLTVPAPAGGIFLAATGPDAKVVDPNDADLLTYLGHFGPTGDVFVSDGERIQDPTTAGAFTGKKTHRRSSTG